MYMYYFPVSVLVRATQTFVKVSGLVLLCDYAQSAAFLSEPFSLMTFCISA